MNIEQTWKSVLDQLQTGMPRASFETWVRDTKALSYFDSCLITNYRYIEALMEKGFILFDNQQHSAALAIFGAVNQIDPLYADGYFWKAKCFENNKQIPEAIEQYQKAQSLDPALKEATIALQQLQKK